MTWRRLVQHAKVVFPWMERGSRSVPTGACYIRVRSARRTARFLPARCVPGQLLGLLGGELVHAPPPALSLDWRLPLLRHESAGTLLMRSQSGQ